jgi:hypothetical protein
VEAAVAVAALGVAPLAVTAALAVATVTAALGVAPLAVTALAPVAVRAAMPAAAHP